MIIDTLQNLSRLSRNPKLDAAFQFLREANAQTENKRYQFDEDRIFVIVKSCETLPANAGQMESHRRYLDVHYNIVGQEGVMWTPLAAASVKADYAEKIDAALYHGPGQLQLPLPVGHFAAFFPEDVHGTEVVVEARSAPVKKAIVKIQLDLLPS